MEQPDSGHQIERAGGQLRSGGGAEDIALPPGQCPEGWIPRASLSGKVEKPLALVDTEIIQARQVQGRASPIFPEKLCKTSVAAADIEDFERSSGLSMGPALERSHPTRPRMIPGGIEGFEVGRIELCIERVEVFSSFGVHCMFALRPGWLAGGMRPRHGPDGIVGRV